MSRATGMMLMVSALSLLCTTACGGGRSARRTAGPRQCQAAVGFEGALGDQLGQQQLAFAKLAVSDDNSSHHTRISLVAADTRSNPSQAATAADQFAIKTRIVAVVGPGSGGEVDAVGPIFARAGLPYISPSATATSLTGGANPTFFRVVAPEGLQGAQEARFVVTRLRARAVMLVGAPTAYSGELAASLAPVFRVAGVRVTRESVSARTQAVPPLLARITPAISAVVLAWQSPAAAEEFGRLASVQRRAVTIVAADRLFAPGVFTIPGSYVFSPAPDITALPDDATLVRQADAALPGFGRLAPPAYAAAHVIDDAIATVCRGGQPPSRSGVLAAIRATNESSSILGIPIRFRADGELADARWFVFRIEASGQYRMLKTP